MKRRPILAVFQRQEGLLRQILCHC